MHVSKFEPGDRITIEQSFTDYDGLQWDRGTVLLYGAQSYFPYEGGYTLTFDKGVMRIAENVDAHGVIIRNEAQAFFRVERASPPA